MWRRNYIRNKPVERNKSIARNNTGQEIYKGATIYLNSHCFLLGFVTARIISSSTPTHQRVLARLPSFRLSLFDRNHYGLADRVLKLQSQHHLVPFLQRRSETDQHDVKFTGEVRLADRHLDAVELAHSH